jgi:hypothetical protein
VVLLVLGALLGAASIAWAEPEVSMRGADDGTVVLVGSGWRPGQRLIVSVGRDAYPALADSAGSFEVHTSLPYDGNADAQLAVRPFSTSTLNFGLLGQPPAPPAPPIAPAAPHPLAILFAQSIADGATWLVVCGLSLAAAGAGHRLLRLGWRGSPTSNI